MEKRQRHSAGDDVAERQQLCQNYTIEAPVNSSEPTSTTTEEAKGTHPADIKALPAQLLLLSSEWLFVKDLLECRRVDRSFQASSKETSLWKRLAHHLWVQALLDGDTSSEMAEEGIPVRPDAPGA